AQACDHARQPYRQLRHLRADPVAPAARLGNGEPRRARCRRGSLDCGACVRPRHHASVHVARSAGADRWALPGCPPTAVREWPSPSVVAAGLLAAIALGVGLDHRAAIIALLLLAAAIASTAWLCRRQIGGQTGDVLGALEQVSETLVLLTAASRV